MKAREGTRGDELLTGTVDELLRDRLAADDGTRGRDRSFGGHVQIQVGEPDESKRAATVGSKGPFDFNIRRPVYNCSFL